MNGIEEYDKINALASGPTGPAAVTGPYAFSSLLGDQTTPLANDDLYGDLMRREDRVLDTVDRVVNHAALADTARASFFHQPLHLIIMRLMETCRFIMEDLILLFSGPTNGAAALARAAALVFVKGDRNIYVGVLLIVLAVACTMISLAF